MPEEFKVRRALLKAMYLYTIVGAGGFGLLILLAPDTTHALFGWPRLERVVSLGVTGSVYLAFALVSLLGLRSPLKFAPILLLQLAYKGVWLLAVVVPAAVAGTFPRYGLLPVIIYATYIVGDLVAVPFGYLFGRESAPAPGISVGPRTRTAAVTP